MVTMFVCERCPAARASRKKRSRSSGSSSVGAWHQLQRDDALEDRVEGAIDDPHPALTDAFLQLVPAKDFHQTCQHYHQQQFCLPRRPQSKRTAPGGDG